MYVHIPFCKRKCLYCDFPSFDNYKNTEEMHLQYTNALLNEIQLKATESKDFIVKTIFFGGGTPTAINVDLTENILKTIFKYFNVWENAEITIEANPATFDEEKANRLRVMGFNRISIGVQAWQNDLLKSIGRLHTIEEFIHSFKIVRNAGFTNVNVDLMFSLPNQTFDMWKETLENIINLNPEHISLYSLIIEEDTPLFNQLEKGIIKEIDEDLDRHMYHFAIDYLKINDYAQYEISNFSKNNSNSKHNIVYWSMTDYLGLGLSSHSYFNKYRFHNTYDIEEYISVYSENQLNKQNKLNKQNIEFVDENNEISEYMFLGLRMNKGILFEDFYKKYNRSIKEVYPNIIEELVSKGLINESESGINLTSLGIDLSNVVFSEFLL